MGVRAAGHRSDVFVFAVGADLEYIHACKHTYMDDTHAALCTASSQQPASWQMLARGRHGGGAAGDTIHVIYMVSDDGSSNGGSSRAMHAALDKG